MTGTADGQHALEEHTRAADVAAMDEDTGESPRRGEHTERGPQRLGDTERLLRDGRGLVEVAHLGQAPREIAAGRDGGRVHETEARTREVAGERRDRSPERGDASRVVTRRVRGQAEVVSGHDGERRVPGGIGQREGAPSLARGVGRLAAKPVMEGERVDHASEPTRIIDLAGERFGLEEQRQDAAFIAEGKQRGAKLQPDVDRRLDEAPVVRAAEGAERLVETRSGRRVIAAREGVDAGAPERVDGRHRPRATAKAQRPRNTGARFSKNAWRASTASSVWKARRMFASS